MAVCRLLWILLSLFLCTVHALDARGVIVTTGSSGNITVLDSSTRQTVAQGPATDGADTSLTGPASILWLGFSILVGAPMSLAGIRGWRLTTGVGAGVTMAMLVWASLVNSLNEDGISDILLTTVVLALAFLAFCAGLWEFARVGSMALLAIDGGLAFGLRVVMSTEGLIVDSYAVIWVIIGALGLLMGGLLLWKQRAGLLLGITSIGTFFIALAVDIIISKQDGMSRGLRFIFDRNPHHLVDILTAGYHPTLTTRIIIWSSMGATPILALLQHKIFSEPFARLDPVGDDQEFAIDDPTTYLAFNTTGKPASFYQRQSGMKSGLWDPRATEFKNSPHRFSLIN
ncbi:hypothetical protein CYLTODRAFT_365063 [Cylindrobasidium torrendii FP15055 ss-10]|uniref:TM7S3/TM198-like domain-containing protein n=1 Tax=Cylindrobasidium torrendii FP15055 ss-10 TaxID=1314674 RepID=A0A0D7BUA2_9AGAR|nr:hypothetical protein CYLTODRAFT_365063 [Cylindrobasidium torrendii FP15055 ss-10]